MKALIIFLLGVTVACGCRSDYDCAQCHTCKASICTAVPDYTDPNEECPIRCNVKTVCGPTHICVFQQRPTCSCDWLEGTCNEEPEAVLIIPTVEEMQRQGLSDVEIKEILYYLKDEHRDPHKGHYHILPEDHAAAHDFIMIGVTLLTVSSLTVILCAFSCMYKILHARELEKEIKSR